jgi:thiamine biosynthesis lipoprotein
MYLQRPPSGAVFVWGSATVSGATAVRRRAVSRSFFALVFLLSLVSLLQACGDPAAFELTGATQGTTWRIAVAADVHKREQLRIRKLVEQRLAEIDLALSSYRSASEVQRFNAAPVGEWFPLGPDLHRVLQAARLVSAQSAGAFDVTSAPLVELWGFGPRGTGPVGGRGTIPGDGAIAAARAQVDYRRVELDEDLPRARKNGALRIDVNGIAQGYTVDCLAEWLLARGYRNFLVEVGGELRLAGLNAAGEPWRIGIEQPADGGGAVQQAVSGTNISITTAGDYHDYFEQDGQRYSHTIDPKTGRPVTHKLASVTVIANSATYADGMDTALEVLGPERGYELAERLKIAAYFIVRSDEGFSARYTPAMERYLLRQ